MPRSTPWCATTSRRAGSAEPQLPTARGTSSAARPSFLPSLSKSSMFSSKDFQTFLWPFCGISRGYKGSKPKVSISKFFRLPAARTTRWARGRVVIVQRHGKDGSTGFGFPVEKSTLFIERHGVSWRGTETPAQMVNEVVNVILDLFALSMPTPTRSLAASRRRVRRRSERRRRFQFCIERFQSIGRLFLQLPQNRNLVVLAARQPEPRTAGRAPAHQMLWVRGYRGHTISGRGFNLIKRLRRHFRATPLCRPALSGRDPTTETRRSKDCRAARGLGFFPIWEFSSLCLCRADDFQSRRNAIPTSVRPPTRRRLAARARARAVARDGSPRSERCHRGSCVGSATRELKWVDPKTLA